MILMKTIKSVFEKFPLYIWTGVLGGVVYSIWVRVAIYSILFPPHLPFVSYDNFFFRVIHFIILTPIIIGDSFGYRLLGLLFFIIVGLSLGIKLRDPGREETRKFILIIVGIAVTAICACWGILAAFLSFWRD